MTIRTSLFLILFLIGNALSAQTYIGKKKDIASILQGIENFSTYLINGDSEKLIDCYSKDAKIFPTDREILSGKSLEKYWTPAADANYTVSHHKITPVEIRVVKKTAYDYGYYEGTTKFDSGETVSWKGKYVIVWKKIAKEWKIYLDCWNAIQTED